MGSESGVFAGVAEGAHGPIAGVGTAHFGFGEVEAGGGSDFDQLLEGCLRPQGFDPLGEVAVLPDALHEQHGRLDGHGFSDFIIRPRGGV